MSEEEIPEMRIKLEQEFFDLLEKGKDIRSYLYFPPELLTESVQESLDILLMKEAYNELIKPDFDMEKFVVYQDDLISIHLDTKEQKIELLERLISYFVSKEEYEKCTIPQQFLNTIN
jgi:hypothetical protein